ncbi:hypothetical protein [Pseudobacteriovorax antillogorgiicola]|uniref:YARHG domain-containing protein n=1 Tax=Pseudobacteriovorax antillogorgiicola TaxID=1513793 RepID=A0A1Y6BWF7_9BACT|nr:hypothetical protein [Pseudobacteriovorax antillogorgiicola]TCS50227.1 hypothetical protein EDD56_11345 [Pseudobacteriovorax antillogorgiicola]SMF32642.1 hypothetical protein SAMN06296036_11044 [Pseudobacteriovorax antillogorgiicola]
MRTITKICSLLFCSSMAMGQESSPQKPKGGEPGWAPPKKLSFTPEQIKAECRKYRNRFIGYYGKVYKIEDCKRRELDSSQVKSLMKRRVDVREVESETVAMIPPGEPFEAAESNRSCTQLNGRYLLSVGGDMYFVEACKKRLFPDWETYVDHSKKRRSKKVYELSEQEFAKLQSGAEIPSVLDREFREQEVLEAESDVIPLQEACAGINGQYVSYYSKVYKIERCRKREVSDPSKLLRKRKVKLRELSSEQWISLPEGESI